MLPLSDRERASSALQMWGELPRKAGTIEDFLALDDEPEDDWFINVIPPEEEAE